MNWSFVVWMMLMVAMVVMYLLMGRRTKRVDTETEDVASTALPMIGKIAERQHERIFGRPPTHTTDSWYPARAAKKKHRHA